MSLSEKYMQHARLYTAPLLVAVLLLLTGITSPQEAKADNITIVADEWCPYNCHPSAKKPGFLIEIAKAVFASHGHTVSYKVFPWARAVSDTREGRYDAIIGALLNDAPNFIFPTEEIGYSQQGFYRHGTQWKYTNISSLKHQRFGTARGYSYGKAIDNLIASGAIKTEPVGGAAPLKQNIRKLFMGRIKLLIAEKSVMEYTLQNMHLKSGVQFAGTPDPGHSVYIAFSPSKPKSKEYARIFTTEMRKMRTSGKLKSILDRYGVKDWK